MNCELMLTYDTPTLQQTGRRNLTGQKTLPTIWGTYMKLATKYKISAINSCWEKCDEKCAYTFCMFNVYKKQLSRQKGSRNLTGPWSQALYSYTISWEVFLDPSYSYFLFADFVDFFTHWTYNVYAHFSSHFSQQLLMAEIWYLVTGFIWNAILWEAFLFPVCRHKQLNQISVINSCWEKCDEKCA
jgi:hypothetical protein